MTFFWQNPVGSYRGERYVQGRSLDELREISRRCLPAEVFEWIADGWFKGERRAVEVMPRLDGRVDVALRYGSILSNRTPFHVEGYGHSDEDTGYETEAGYCRATKMAAQEALRKVDRYARVWK